MPIIAIGSGHWSSGFSNERFSKSGTEDKFMEGVPLPGSGVIEIGAILIDGAGRFMEGL